MEHLSGHRFFLILGTVLLIGTTCTSQSVLPKAYSSYRPLPLCNPSDYVRYPKTIEDVVSIVNEAIAQGKTVKAFGARHSQTDVICTDGIPIDNHGIKFYQINPDGTATFGAGVTLHDATEYLRQNGRAFRTTPAFGNITLAGATGTGAHGSSIKYTSSISSQVVGMTIVDGLGNIKEITEEGDLKAFRIHLGLLGIVVRITLTSQPLYKTLAHNYVVPDTVLTDGTAQAWAQSADQMSLYWFPSSGQVVVANWAILPDVTTPGDAYTYDHVPSTYSTFNSFVVPAFEQFAALTQDKCGLVRKAGYNIFNAFQAIMLNSLVTTVPDWVPIYTEDGVTVQNPSVGYYDKMFAPVCNDGAPGRGPGNDLQCPWGHGEVNANLTILDNEISLALSDMPAFIAAVKDILSKAPALFPIQGILMRFSANSTTYMSTAYGRDTVHFEWYIRNRQNELADSPPGQAAYQTIMQTLTKRFGGRSHWGKSGLVYQSKEMIDLKMDPAARQAFVAVMNKYDPNEVFINKFGRRIKGTSSDQDKDTARTRCALKDDCFCTKNSDCADYQTCTTLPGYGDYKVCQTKGETAQDFQPAVVDPRVGVNEFLSTTLSGLNSLTQGLRNSVQCAVDNLLG